MPKLKRASSSLTASRAKKRKKLRIPERLQQDSDENDVRQETDENNVRQEMRRLRNTEARRIVHLDSL